VLAHKYPAILAELNEKFGDSSPVLKAPKNTKAAPAARLTHKTATNTSSR
jgi:hypothetical protein